jgi:ATP-dependent DNA helicase DinG
MEESDISDLELENSPELDKNSVLSIVAKDGPLSRCLKGFELREQQKQMLLDILNAYNKNKIALIEAGTGTGKSMAYLIPAVLWALKFHERTVISTNTINLQEQLIQKDLPLLIKALGVDIKAVLVKGIGNYVCLRKLQEVKYQFNFLSPSDAAELEKIEAWSRTTRDGSRSSLPLVPSSASWELAGAEYDTCNKRQCEFFRDCFYYKARQQAEDAQIVVVNHHLLCSDLRKKEEDGEESGILPPYSRIILDEAHNLETVATDFFADHISQLEIFKILHKLSSDKIGETLGKLPLLRQAIETCFKKNPPLEVAFLLKCLITDLPGLRWDLWHQLETTFEAFSQFAHSLQDKANPSQEDLIPGDVKLRLRPFHQTHPDWQGKILPQANKLAEAFTHFITTIENMEKNIKSIKNDRLQEVTKNVLFDVMSLTAKLSGYNDILKNYISPEFPPEKVRWIEVQNQQRGQNISIINADLDVSKALVKYLFDKFNTIVLCSATLTANQEFSFIRQRLGLVPELLKIDVVTENIFDSPFDYPRQAMFAIPTDIPLPSDPKFTQAAVENIWQAIQASHGNAFVLFTSYSMLNECYQLLLNRLNTHKYFPLKQGEMNRGALLNKFKNVNRSVLFGTESFWEGVDVVGEALRCVMLVKLPFKVPSEPIIQARSEAIIAKGGDPFLEYSLPQAIVKFKQGFGRLIRNKRDRGCVICLDIRLLKKGYGQLFLKSLPPCQQVFAVGGQLYQAMVEFYRKTYPRV